MIEELIRSSQEMEIQIINFITKHLLSSSFQICSKKLTKIVGILDLGSTLDYSSYNLNSQGMHSISRLCIANLFDLCNYKLFADCIYKLFKN